MEYTFQVIQPAIVSTIANVEASGYSAALSQIESGASELYPPNWYVLTEPHAEEGKFFISKSAGVLGLEGHPPSFYLLSSGNFIA